MAGRLGYQPWLCGWVTSQSARELGVKIFVPHKRWLNIFGTARDSRFEWYNMDICQPHKYPHVYNVLKDTVCVLTPHTLYLYSGSFAGMASFSSIIDGTNNDVISLVPGSVRLNQLKSLRAFSWRRLHHRELGGCTTNGSYWMGSAGGIQHNFVAYRTNPVYCPSALKDVLTFAPKEVSIVAFNIDPHHNPSKSIIV